MDKKKLTEWFMKNHESAQHIDWTLEIKVCKSAAGYYIGMTEKYGIPHCRLSVEYFTSLEEAEKALEEGEFGARTWL